MDPHIALEAELAPPKFVFDEAGRRGSAVDSLVSSGCIVSGADVRRSVVDKYCHLPDGFSVGIDHDADRARGFHG